MCARVREWLQGTGGKEFESKAHTLVVAMGVGAMAAATVAAGMAAATVAEARAVATEVAGKEVERAVEEREAALGEAMVAAVKAVERGEED